MWRTVFLIQIIWYAVSCEHCLQAKNYSYQDTILLGLQHNYSHVDSLIQANDSLGSYRAALEASNRGLTEAKKKNDLDMQRIYHLKLAKYNYLLGYSTEAIKHLRLYALTRSKEIEEEKDLEIRLLEDAYLEEINILLTEMEMDKTLIDNLQAENEEYFQAQQKVKIALQIGFAIVLLVLVLIGYNRFRNKKTHIKERQQEIEEQNSLEARAEKLEYELQRTNKELSRYKESHHHSLSYARNIQLSLLPTEPEFSASIGNSFIVHLPKKIISGDFYAIYPNGDKTIVAVFDCPGHDVNAAHSTVVSHNIFKEITSQGITAPSMILTLMDQKLKHETEQLEPRKELQSGTKIAVCTIKNDTKEVEYSGAHFPLFYVHLDELHFVRGNRFPIGDPLFSDKFYSSSNIRLSTGDMIYLCTDGYYSQLGGKKNKKFLRSSLSNLLMTIHNQDIKEQQFILEKVFREWKGHEEQTDDVMVMGFRL